MMKKLILLAVTTMLAGGAAAQSGGFSGGATNGPMQCTTKQCTVTITPSCKADNSGCGGTIDYDPIRLQRGNKDVKLTWVLPTGFVFCRKQNDGVFLTNGPSNQFEEDPANGQGGCKRDFKMKGLNSVPAPNAPYIYEIRFRRESDNKPYLIDPSMVNE